MRPLAPFICRRCIHSISPIRRLPQGSAQDASPTNIQQRKYKSDDRVVANLHASRKRSPILIEDLNYYWDTKPPSIAQLTHANTYFESAIPPRFLLGTPKFREFPESDVPEVAFLGRSNVGKSSLLNAVFNRPNKPLAHVSKTPGRTQTMNAYGIGSLDDGVRVKPKTQHTHAKIIGRGGLVVVDMPGYGKGSREEWGPEILKYLTQRKQLRRAFLLVDAEHGLQRQDHDILRILRFHNVSHQIIISKIDKTLFSGGKTRHERFQTIDEKTFPKLRKYHENLRKEIQPTQGGSALGEIIACSSTENLQQRRLGIEGVRFAILQAAGLAATSKGVKLDVEPWTKDDEEFLVAEKDGSVSRGRTGAASIRRLHVAQRRSPAVHFKARGNKPRIRMS